MAMQKTYTRINWENYPSIDTPLNEQNLNKIDKATNEIDNRVITHEEVKATKVEVAPLIKEIAFNSKNGVFTITRKDGSTFTIDTLLEKIQTNWDYDPNTQKLILTMEDGSKREIDLSELITQFEFLDTATIDFVVDKAGKVSANVKEGSINEKHLRPEYLAEIRVESARAEAASAAAELSAGNAKKSENAAASSANASANSASDSADSADASAASAAAALASQNAAKASETAAKNSQTAAKTSETNAKASETAAKTSETNAGKSATAAANSASAAAGSATASASSAEDAATSEANAAKSASAASTSEKNAASSASTATTQANSARSSATSAAGSASTATSKATDAANSATEAATSATTATNQAKAASTSATTATTQANSAKTSATQAADYAKRAQSYAVGGTDYRTGEATDNAKYYYEQSKSISESFSGALRPMGTVAFNQLPAVSKAAAGDMYNISNDFTTTTDFNEGASHPYPAGTNVYKTSDGKWDCLAGTPVTSVNGARGNVKVNVPTAYGTCATAATEAAKVITISNNPNWQLVAGSIIVVKFTYTNSAQNPTFNVNNTGAKRVWYNTAQLSTSALGMAGTAGRPMVFCYDGTEYVFIGWSIDNNTTYSNASLGQGYGTCTTAANTLQKDVTLSGYALAVGGIVSVKFTNAVQASATMNINSKGVKSIFYKGAAIAANIIKAGDTATFIYNGTQYHLISIDNRIPVADKVANALKFTGTASVTYDGSSAQTVTLTDQKVLQANTTTNADYRVLFSNNANDTNETAGARKHSGLKYNPSTGNLSATKLTSQTGDSTVAFTSEDVAGDASATTWTVVSQLTSGIKHNEFFKRVSQMFKNIRYLYKLLGTTSLAGIGDSTVTGAINALNTNIYSLSVNFRWQKCMGDDTITYKPTRKPVASSTYLIFASVMLPNGTPGEIVVSSFGVNWGNNSADFINAFGNFLKSVAYDANSGSFEILLTSELYCSLFIIELL